MTKAGEIDAGFAERCALLRLTLTQGLGPVAVARLLSAFGTATAALDESAVPIERWAEALSCALARAGRCRAAAGAIDVEAELHSTRAVGARLVAISDVDYPVLLRAIHDPPPLLWLRGAFEAIDAWSVAIVGARRCSAYGLDQASRFARGLVAQGHTIVSGGARGIDAEAHRAALRAGARTIAVLGSGLAKPYPPENAGLFDEIVASGGAVISEQPAAMAPRPDLFPRRNRIISGLSLGVVLIEARARSGASITARLAVEDHGREAMAMPGRVDSATSDGAHRAIREGWAALVRSPEDVIEQLASAGHLVRGATERAGNAQSIGATGPPPADEEAPGARCPVVLPESAARVGRRILDRGSATLEQALGEDPVQEVLAALTTLEILGLVRRDADGAFHARRELAVALKSSAAHRL